MTTVGGTCLAIALGYGLYLVMRGVTNYLCRRGEDSWKDRKGGW